MARRCFIVIEYDLCICGIHLVLVLREYHIFAIFLHVFHIIEISCVNSSGANVEELCFFVLGNVFFCLGIVMCTELICVVNYISQGKIRSNH